MERPCVLVVEDRPSVLRLIASVLEPYEVYTAGDVATALAAVDTLRLDVALTDVRLRCESGFDVLRRVREQGLRTQVVLMTAYANVPDAVAAIKQGAFDYVAKPVDADGLALVVARAASHAGGATPPVERAPAERLGEPPILLGFHGAVEEVRYRASREYLESLMRAYRGNVTQAALAARMTRESLHRVLRQHDVRAEEHRDGSGEAQVAAETDRSPHRSVF